MVFTGYFRQYVIGFYLKIRLFENTVLFSDSIDIFPSFYLRFNSANSYNWSFVKFILLIFSENILSSKIRHVNLRE
jgi:hypothetical protein